MAERRSPAALARARVSRWGRRRRAARFPSGVRADAVVERIARLGPEAVPLPATRGLWSSQAPACPHRRSSPQGQAEGGFGDDPARRRQAQPTAIWGTRSRQGLATVALP